MLFLWSIVMHKHFFFSFPVFEIGTYLLVIELAKLTRTITFFLTLFRPDNLKNFRIRQLLLSPFFKNRIIYKETVI